MAVRYLRNDPPCGIDCRNLSSYRRRNHYLRGLCTAAAVDSDLEGCAPSPSAASAGRSTHTDAVSSAVASRGAEQLRHAIC